jgi:hypothetical protein
MAAKMLSIAIRLPRVNDRYRRRAGVAAAGVAAAGVAAAGVAAAGVAAAGVAAAGVAAAGVAAAAAGNEEGVNGGDGGGEAPSWPAAAGRPH